MLKPADLSNQKNLSRWRQAWKKFATRDVMKKWEEALKILRAFNGESFTQGSSKISYIINVVRNLCKQVPSPLREDLSQIKGLDRLAKEVALYFDGGDDKVLLVGLHGVAGSGKTTMCKIMANFYSAQYLGRCYHLELPTSMHGESIVPQTVQECKKALKQLTNLRDKFLNKASNLDQVIELMKTHFRRLDVFLAIDNVYEDSFEVVARILEVGYSANSKILLTSRGVQILDAFLCNRSNACVRRLPDINFNEAFQIFQDAVGKGSIDFLNCCRVRVDHIIKKSSFGRSYHALGLKALGGYVRKGCMVGDLREKEEFLCHVGEQLWNTDLETLDKVIRIKYDVLPKHKKNMFHDIVTMISTLREFGYGRVTHKEAIQWLSTLYQEDQLHKTNIRTLIYELAEDGLVQLEMESDGSTLGQGRGTDWRVTVHDLYSELGHREAATDSRFFMCQKLNKPLKQMEWENLEAAELSPDEKSRLILENYGRKMGPMVMMNSERVLLDPDDEQSRLFMENVERVVLGPGDHCRLFMQMAQQQEFKKLQVLWARNIHLDTQEIDMGRMPSLCFLNLSNVTLSIKNWSAASRLGFVFLSNVKIYGITNFLSHGHSSMRVLSLGTLIQLQALHLHRLDDLEMIQGLEFLVQLDTLSVGGCHCLENLDGLGALPRLKALHITSCPKVKRLPDLSRLTCLEELLLADNDNMEEVEGVSPPALNSIRISFCAALKSTPDLSGSTVLEELLLYHNSSMEAVHGVLSSSLTDLRIQECPVIERRVDLSGLTRLDNLVLENLMMQELRAQLSSSLKVMRISNCDVLKAMPDLRDLTCLAVLELRWNQEMEAVGCLASTLQEITVSDCSALKKIPDLSGLTRLHNLEVSGNRLVEEVGCLSCTVKNLRVEGCGALQTMPDISGLTCLKSLRLENNPSLEEVRGE